MNYASNKPTYSLVMLPSPANAPLGIDVIWFPYRNLVGVFRQTTTTTSTTTATIPIPTTIIIVANTNYQKHTTLRMLSVFILYQVPSNLGLLHAGMLVRFSSSQSGKQLGHATPCDDELFYLRICQEQI